jgi:hypothetical protein
MFLCYLIIFSTSPWYLYEFSVVSYICYNLFFSVKYKGIPVVYKCRYLLLYSLIWISTKTVPSTLSNSFPLPSEFGTSHLTLGIPFHSWLHYILPVLCPSTCPKYRTLIKEVRNPRTSGWSRRPTICLSISNIFPPLQPCIRSAFPRVDLPVPARVLTYIRIWTLSF